MRLYLNRLKPYLLSSLKLSGIAVIACLCIACVSTSLPNSAPIVPEQNEEASALPVDPDIVKGKLSNGINYIIRENAKPEQFAELRLVVKTGSIFEDESQLGFAHFAEHMAFNGTEDFKEQEIVEFVESIGMRFGAHLNATTSFDSTIYQLRIPTGDPAIVEKAIHILENWAHKVNFEPQTVDEERGVVLEEWRSRKGVQERIAKQKWPIMFAGTNYAERLPIGTQEIITQGQVADLERFYKTWYRPDLISVVAVGDFASNDIKALIEKYFGKIKAATAAAETPLQFLKVYDQPVFSVFTDDELRSNTLSTSWRREIKANEHNLSTYKQQVIQNLLTGALSKRVNDIALDTQSPFSGARIGANVIIPSAQEFYFRASVKPQRSEEAFRRLLTELKRVVEHGLSEQELEREKRLYLEWFESALKSQNTLDNNAFVGSYVNHFLRNSAITSLEQDFALSSQFLAEITLDDIQDQMKAWADHQNAVVFLTAPSKVEGELPSADKLASIWQDVENTPTVALEDKAQITALMNSQPKPGKVLTKSYIEAWDAHEWLLSNGIKVILKPSDFTENSIQFRAYSDGGYALVDDDTYLSSFGLMDTLHFMGLGALNMEQFAQFSREKRFSVTPRIDTYSEGMSGMSNIEDLRYMMQAIYLRFTGPVKDAERFEWLKDTYRPRLKNKYNSPAAQFYAAIQAKTQAGNPRNVEFNVDMLERQNIDTIYQVYQERFANPSDFTFVFVGDIDLDEMEDLLTTYVGSLETTNVKDKLSKLPNYTLKGDYQIHMEKGTEPKATVITSLFGEGEWTYKNQLVTSAFQAALERSLRTRLREELGGVYSVGVNASLQRWPYQNYSVTVSFTCDPDRVDELYDEVNKVFAKFVEGDIDEQLVENFKTQAKISRQKSLKENGFWLSYILNHYSPYRPLALAEYDALVESIDFEQVQNVAKKYLTSQNRLYASLKPEPTQAQTTDHSQE